jgi:hypothetical protein
MAVSGTDKLVKESVVIGEQYREVYKCIEGKWVSIKFEDIKKGDCVKLFEVDGSPVEKKDGSNIFVADSDAFPDDKMPGNYGVIFRI